MRSAMGTPIISHTAIPYEHRSTNLTLTYILERFNVDPLAEKYGSPLEIPNFGRDQLAELFAELGFSRGAEIGVKCGEYSEVLLKANPKLMLFGADTYQSYEAYRTISQERQDQNKKEAVERLMPYVQYGRYRFLEQSSVEAAKGFKDGELDFVFVDASHKFEDVVADIAAWSRVVKPSGIVSGHDFVRRSHGRDGGPNTSHHVVDAVLGYVNAYKIAPLFILGRYEKREGEVRDKERSWFWIKT